MPNSRRNLKILKQQQQTGIRIPAIMLSFLLIYSKIQKSSIVIKSKTFTFLKFINIYFFIISGLRCPTVRHRNQRLPLPATQIWSINFGWSLSGVRSWICPSFQNIFHVYKYRRFSHFFSFSRWKSNTIFSNTVFGTFRYWQHESPSKNKEYYVVSFRRSSSFCYGKVHLII